jgi:competence ComEA-like helix-hairpin-helix protein
MLTPAERNSLLLTLGFLLLGAGIKVWKKWRVEIGPFDPGSMTSTLRDSTLAPSASPDTPPDSLPGETSLANAPQADSSRSAPGDTVPVSRKAARRGIPKPQKPAPACPVDLNSASEDRLANLPGVGPRTASALAAYRKEHGPFRDNRELLQVKGIGEKKLALIAPCLILSGAAASPLSAQAETGPEAGGEADPAGPAKP